MKRSEWDEVFRLDGRAAIVTGASGHLGAAMAEGLAAAGAHVWLVGRNTDRLNELKLRIIADGGQASCEPVDLTDETALRAAVRRIGEAAGRIDIVVNNAYSGAGGTVGTAAVKDFEDSYRIAVVAPMIIMQEARPWLREAARRVPGGASVINIGSMYGMVSPDRRVYETERGANPPFYGAAKAGLLQLTRYAACEMAPEGIRVNSISPGPFPSPAVQAADPTFVDRLRHKVPMGRMGVPADLMGAVVYLASSAAAYVTGTNLVVDGGWTAW